MSPLDGFSEGASQALALTGIAGAKGAKQSSPYEAPNSLRAKQILRVIFLLGEGPQQGLINGGHSIYFGEPPIPLVSDDGSSNYLGVTWEYRDGSPGQAPFTGIPAVENSFNYGDRVTQAAGPKIHSVDCTLGDRLRFITTFPALVEVNPTSGDQYGTSVQYKVEWRASGTQNNWTDLFIDEVSGKNTAPYPHAVVVPSPLRGIAEFRMTRLTADSLTSNLANDLIWSGIVVITDRLLEYPGCTMVAMTVDAEQFGSDLSTVTFGVRQLLCWVPTNYDPVARTYATSGLGTSGGIWDGSLKRAYSNNPAWVFLTAATDPDWGCGTEISAYVDPYVLYNIATYCDERVPDGLGGSGTEPRYTFNAYINTRDEALRVLQVIAQAFRGMLYWGGGRIVPIADMPTTPVKTVVPANVIDGRFEYEGSSINSRHNVVKVQWRDPALNYRMNIEVMQDAESIALYGDLREIEYDAIGCTSRGLARRLAKWILYTEKYETEMLRYRAFRDHANISPGDVILVADPAKIGVSLGGRLLGPASQFQIALDRKVTLTQGLTYTVRVQLPDGTVSAALPVLNALNTTPDTLILGSTGLPAGNLPNGNAVWMLIVNNAPFHYRVMDVTENGDETYSVTGLRHTPGKFGLVEGTGTIQDEPWTIYPTTIGPMAPPTNVDANEYIWGIGNTANLKVTLSWTASTDRRALRYEVQAIMGQVVVRSAITEQVLYEFADLSPGLYLFQVRALGDNNIASAWVQANGGAVNVDGFADPPLNPSNLSATGAIHSNLISWTNPTSRYLRSVEVWASANSLFSAASKVGEASYGRFVHDGLLPEVTRYYWIRSVDIFNTFSAFVGPVSATTSFLIASSIAEGIVNTASFADGIAPVVLIANLNVSAADGTVALNKADGKLYTRKNGQWVETIQPLGPGGTLTSAQIADLNAAKLTGNLTATIFPTNLRPLEVVAALPSTGNFEGRQVYLTTDDKIYRHNGSSLTTTAGWISTTAAADIAGQLTAAQIASITAAQLTGQITATQIGDGAISTPKLAAGSVTTAALAAGSVVAATIASGAISTVKIAAGAITAGTIATDAITSGKIAAGVVTATELGANSVTASKLNIVPGSLNADPYFRDQSAWFRDAGSWVFDTRSTGNASDVLGVPSSIALWSGNYTGTGTVQTIGLQRIPVTPGERIALKIKGYNSSNRQIVAFIAYLNGAGGYVGGSAIVAWNPGEAPQYKELQDAVLANAAVAYLTVYVVAGAAFSGIAAVSDAVIVKPATASMVVDGAITARALSAGSVLTASLAAGAVTTSKLSVGGSNLMFNSCLTRSTDGFIAAGVGGGAAPTLGTAIKGGLAAWVPPAFGGGYLFRPGVVGNGQGCVADWRPDPAYFGIPCQPGDRVQARAQLGTHRCAGQLQLIFLGANNAELGRVSSVATTTPNGGRMDWDFAAHAVIGTAPTGTLLALFRVAMNGNGGSDCYVFFTKCLVGLAPANAVEVMPWEPGGVTEISGGSVRAFTIQAEQLAANSIEAGKIAADAVVAGTIAAGAVNAREIRSGAIRADKLAAEEIISDTIQVRNLVIGTSKIGLNGASELIFAEALDNSFWGIQSRDGRFGGYDELFTYQLAVFVNQSNDFGYSPRFNLGNRFDWGAGANWVTADNPGTGITGYRFIRWIRPWHTAQNPAYSDHQPQDFLDRPWQQAPGDGYHVFQHFIRYWSVDGPPWSGSVRVGPRFFACTLQKR